MLWEHFRQQAEQQRKNNMQAILDAQENERKIIAREVHDNLGPILSISAMQADILSLAVSGTKEAALVQNIKSQLQEAVYICRQVSHELTPILYPGMTLQEMVSGYVETINSTGKLQITMLIYIDSIILHEQKATSLCRVVTELLHNTLKHANATEAAINISIKNDSLLLEYQDNGTGLIPNQKVKGIGLANIHSRISLLNGTISIPDPSPVKGFFISIKVPLSSLQ